LRAALPEAVDFDLPTVGAFQNIAILSIRKEFPGQARKAVFALWGMGSFALLKSIVVVDDFVDVHDYEQVAFHVGANVDPARDIFVCHGPLDQLDHAALQPCYGGRIGIDATHKLNEEGGRDWPERIVMSEEIRSLVARRWHEYGLDSAVESNDDRGLF
jgi:4-hydroxy-3-polyprenylbenzoate decarboxylase